MMTSIKCWQEDWLRNIISIIISTYFMTGVSAAENFGQACYVPPVIFMSVIQVKLTKIWQNFFKEKIII